MEHKHDGDIAAAEHALGVDHMLYRNIQPNDLLFLHDVADLVHAGDKVNFAHLTSQ